MDLEEQIVEQLLEFKDIRKQWADKCVMAKELDPTTRTTEFESLGDLIEYENCCRANEIAAQTAREEADNLEFEMRRVQKKVNDLIPSSHFVTVHFMADGIRFVVSKGETHAEIRFREPLQSM